MEYSQFGLAPGDKGGAPLPIEPALETIPLPMSVGPKKVEKLYHIIIRCCIPEVTAYVHNVFQSIEPIFSLVGQLVKR